MKKWLNGMLIPVFVVAIYIPSVSQDDPQVFTPYPWIEFNGTTEKFNAPFPYYQRFNILIKKLKDSTNFIRVTLTEQLGGTIDTKVIQKSKYAFKYIPDVYLKPNTAYSLTIEYPGFETTKTIASYSKFSDYAKVDFGFAYASNIKGYFSLTGVHLSFAPVNRNSDLGYLATKRLKGPIKQFSQRASLYFGVSPFMVASNTEQPIKNLNALGNFVYGFGWRSPFYGYFGSSRSKTFLQPMRLVAGWIVFNQDGANPLIPTVSQKQAFYVGLTYDINLAPLLGPIGNAFKPK